MGIFKLVQRRKWKDAVASEFRRQHGVDLRTVADVIGRTTLDDLLNDEYALDPRNAAAGARSLTHVLAQIFRLDPASLAVRDVALKIRVAAGFASADSDLGEDGAARSRRGAHATSRPGDLP